MAESVPAPVHKLPNGQWFISDEACEDMREVADFVKRFPDYWIRDPDLCGFVAVTGDQAQETITKRVTAPL